MYDSILPNATEVQQAARQSQGFYAVASNGDVNALRDFRLPGQSNAAVGANGEINASSHSDAIQQGARLMQARASGQIRHTYQLDRAVMGDALLTASGSLPHMQALASNAAGVVTEVNAREGFLRTIFQHQPLENGNVPTVSMPTHDVVAMVVTGPGSVKAQDVVDRRIQPPEVTMQTLVTATTLEIKRNPGDQISQMYDQSIEAQQVKEDNLSVQLLRGNGAIGPNKDILVAGALTPRLLARIANTPMTNNLPAANMLIASNLWQDIAAEPDFHAMFDPVHRYELVLTGRLPTIFGYTMITDGFRKENQRVLRQGEIFALSSKEHLGVFTDRGGVDATAVDGASQGHDKRGWMLIEHFSACAPNARASQRYQRV